MSSYLLLRNNKESGPFTMDEIKAMPLGSYDLIWEVGKSASWCYPGEISEFRSFAPAVPEKDTDFFRKKSNNDNLPADSSGNKTPDSANGQRSTISSQRITASRSVYVNLPAEKKTVIIPPARISQDAGFISSDIREPSYDFSDLYKKPPAKIVLYSGKILWISTITLLFGAGVLTGFFISDRRKFFSTDENHPQNNPAVRPVLLNNKKEFSTVKVNHNYQNTTSEDAVLKNDSLKKAGSVPKKLKSSAGKKSLVNNAANKDSAVSRPAILSSVSTNDSLKHAMSEKDALYQKIKSHPENYINLVTGRYSTGIFGGISSFPVTVSNNSPVKMDLIVVSIDYIQNNEKIFKTEILSFNDLAPGETVTIKAPKSARGTKIATHIRTVNSRQPETSSSN
jgi:uncharacterized protein YneF (UPF0154 family)